MSERGTKTRILNLIGRVALFAVILTMGAITAVMADEVAGLPTTRRPVQPAQTMTVAAQDDVLYAALINQRNPTGVYQSRDGGRTWQLLRSQTNVSLVALVHSTNQDVLYIASPDPAVLANGLWHSDDGGETWQRLMLSQPAAPYDLPPTVMGQAVLGLHQPQILYLAADRQGEYYIDMGRSPSGYELISALSLQPYRETNREGAIIGPDGRIYTLTGSNELLVPGSNPWERLGMLFEAAAGLVRTRFGLEKQEPALVWNLDSPAGQERYDRPEANRGTVIRVAALAVDEQETGHLLLTTLTYGRKQSWTDKGIYESRDAGRSWTRLANAPGIVVMQLPTHFSDPVEAMEGRGNQDQPVLAIPRGAAPPSARLTGTQLLILILTGSLAGLVLIDRRDWIIEGRKQYKPI